MIDKPIHIHIDSTEQRADIPNVCPDTCPDCGTEAVTSFGLAGGGFGVYTYCPKCAKILGKVQIKE